MARKKKVEEPKAEELDALGPEVVLNDVDPEEGEIESPKIGKIKVKGHHPITKEAVYL